MDAKIIGQRIKALRIAKNASRKQFADAVGVGGSAIRMYENGERIPNDEVKQRMSKYFEKSVDSIFFAD